MPCQAVSIDAFRLARGGGIGAWRRARAVLAGGKVPPSRRASARGGAAHQQTRAIKHIAPIASKDISARPARVSPAYGIRRAS